MEGEGPAGGASGAGAPGRRGGRRAGRGGRSRARGGRGPAQPADRSAPPPGGGSAAAAHPDPFAPSSGPAFGGASPQLSASPPTAGARLDPFAPARPSRAQQRSGKRASRAPAGSFGAVDRFPTTADPFAPQGGSFAAPAGSFAATAGSFGAPAASFAAPARPFAAQVDPFAATADPFAAAPADPFAKESFGTDTFASRRATTMGIVDDPFAKGDAGPDAFGRRASQRSGGSGMVMDPFASASSPQAGASMSSGFGMQGKRENIGADLFGQPPSRPAQPTVVDPFAPSNAKLPDADVLTAPPLSFVPTFDAHAPAPVFTPPVASTRRGKGMSEGLGPRGSFAAKESKPEPSVSLDPFQNPSNRTTENSKGFGASAMKRPAPSKICNQDKTGRNEVLIQYLPPPLQSEKALAMHIEKAMPGASFDVSMSRGRKKTAKVTFGTSVDAKKSLSHVSGYGGKSLQMSIYIPQAERAAGRASGRDSVNARDESAHEAGGDATLSAPHVEPLPDVARDAPARGVRAPEDVVSKMEEMRRKIAEMEAEKKAAESRRTPQMPQIDEGNIPEQKPVHFAAVLPPSAGHDLNPVEEHRSSSPPAVPTLGSVSEVRRSVLSKTEMGFLERKIASARAEERLAAQGWREQPGKVLLEDAEEFVGTCTAMCPIKEQSSRIEISEFEKRPLGDDNAVLVPDLMVKKYVRSAAAVSRPGHEEVRPPHVLERTMDYLLTNILTDETYSLEEVYDFINDRCRCVRQDLALQGAHTNDATLAVLEKAVRFHILSEHRLAGKDIEVFDSKMNMEQLHKCLTSTRLVYDARREAGLTSSNESEFQAYQILCFPSEMNQTCSTLSPNVLNSLEVQFALRAMLCVAGQTLYAEFVQMIRDAPILVACLMYRKLAVVWKQALKIMSSVIGHARRRERVSLGVLVDTLGFEDEEQALHFCEYHGLSNDGESVLLDAKDFIDPKTPWKDLPAPRLVESKSVGHDLAEVVLGQKQEFYGKISRDRIICDLPTSHDSVTRPSRKRGIPASLVIATPVRVAHMKAERDKVLEEARCKTNERLLAWGPQPTSGVGNTGKDSLSAASPLPHVDKQERTPAERSDSESGALPSPPGLFGQAPGIPKFFAPEPIATPKTSSSLHQDVPILSTQRPNAFMAPQFSLHSGPAGAPQVRKSPRPNGEHGSEAELGSSPEFQLHAVAPSEGIIPAPATKRFPELEKVHRETTDADQLRDQSASNMYSTTSRLPGVQFETPSAPISSAREEFPKVPSVSKMDLLRQCLKDANSISFGDQGIKSVKDDFQRAKEMRPREARARAHELVAKLKGPVWKGFTDVWGQMRDVDATGDVALEALKSDLERIVCDNARTAQATIEEIEKFGLSAGLRLCHEEGAEALEPFDDSEDFVQAVGPPKQSGPNVLHVASPFSESQGVPFTGEVSLRCILPQIQESMWANCMDRHQMVVLNLAEGGLDARAWALGMLSGDNVAGVIALEVESSPMESWLSVVEAENGQFSNDTATALIVPVDVAPNQHLPPVRLRGKLQTALVKARRNSLARSRPPVLILVLNSEAEPGMQYEAEVRDLLDVGLMEQNGLIAASRIVHVGLTRNRWDPETPQHHFEDALLSSVAIGTRRALPRTGFSSVADMAVSRGSRAWLRSVAAIENEANPYRATLVAINAAWRRLGGEISDESRTWAREYGGERERLYRIGDAVSAALELPGVGNVTKENANTYVLRLARALFGGHRGIVDPSLSVIGHTYFCHAIGQLLPNFVSKVLGRVGGSMIDLPVLSKGGSANSLRMRAPCVSVGELVFSNASKKSLQSVIGEECVRQLSGGDDSQRQGAVRKRSRRLSEDPLQPRHQQTSMASTSPGFEIVCGGSGFNSYSRKRARTGLPKSSSSDSDVPRELLFSPDADQKDPIQASHDAVSGRRQTLVSAQEIERLDMFLDDAKAYLQRSNQWIHCLAHDRPLM